MRLAGDRFKLELGSRTFVLRPSLRAAFNLEMKYGLQNLYNAIVDGNFSACSDLIDATCTDQKSWTAYSLTGMQLSEIMDAREQLLRFVLLLAVIDPDAEDSKSEGEPISFEEQFTRLFQIGTGRLGWSPQQTWDATPAEILNAKIGRDELLAEIFGGAKADETEINIKDADGRAELNRLGRSQRATPKRAG